MAWPGPVGEPLLGVRRCFRNEASLLGDLFLWNGPGSGSSPTPCSALPLPPRIVGQMGMRFLGMRFPGTAYPRWKLSEDEALRLQPSSRSPGETALSIPSLLKFQLCGSFLGSSTPAVTPFTRPCPTGWPVPVSIGIGGCSPKCAAFWYWELSKITEGED